LNKNLFKILIKLNYLKIIHINYYFKLKTKIEGLSKEKFNEIFKSIFAIKKN